LHFLVSEHEVLSDKEAQLVLEEYGVTKDQLPKIYEADAGLKGLNFKVGGDIIRIKRKRPTSPSGAVYYRVVVEGEIPKIKQRKKEEEFYEDEDEGGDDEGSGE